MYRDDSPSVAIDVTSEALTNGKRTEGTTFFLAGDKWVYNLGTKDFQEVGSYHAIMVSGDPSEYIIDPTCKGLFIIENRP